MARFKYSSVVVLALVIFISLDEVHGLKCYECGYTSATPLCKNVNEAGRKDYECPATSKGCAVLVLKDGSGFKRLCGDQSSGTTDSEEGTMRFCGTDNCNTGYGPLLESKDLYCFVCGGEKEPECTESYNGRIEKCYPPYPDWKTKSGCGNTTYFDEGGRIERGGCRLMDRSKKEYCDAGTVLSHCSCDWDYCNGDSKSGSSGDGAGGGSGGSGSSSESGSGGKSEAGYLCGLTAIQIPIVSLFTFVAARLVSFIGGQ